MLRLITSKQISDSDSRLWLHDQDNDLFVWLDILNKPISFQFCYDKKFNEKIISWHHINGFNHNCIDAGEGKAHRYKMTPIMTPADSLNPKQITKIFYSHSRDIEPVLKDFIYQKILSYSEIDSSNNATSQSL